MVDRRVGVFRKKNLNDGQGARDRANGELRYAPRAELSLSSSADVDRPAPRAMVAIIATLVVVTA